MLCNDIQTYLERLKGKPFFYAVGDADYSETLNELKQLGVQVQHASDFCLAEDKFPDLDEIIDHFRTLDVDYSSNRHVLVGLGEFLALRGSSYTQQELRRLSGINLGSARVVLLLRCVTQQVYSLSNEDPRLEAQGRMYIAENALSNLSVTSVKYKLNDQVATGIQNLLRRMENGAQGDCHVCTTMSFSNSLIPVRNIKSAHAAVCQKLPDLDVDQSVGTEDQWDTFFQELSKCSFSFPLLLDRYMIRNDIDELYHNCIGKDFRNWLFFISLKQDVSAISNQYLRRVVKNTKVFLDLKDNILNEIIKIPRTDPKFPRLYAERKKLIRHFPESELAIFVRENDVDQNESIYRYTDCTELERKMIIRWISDYGYIPEIDMIYPALGAYLKDYTFHCGKLSDYLTQYFKQYRMQKVENHIYATFREEVQKNATNLPYLSVETRDNIIKHIPDKENTFLYWIDALGVEYIPYIADRARKKGLSIQAEIAQVQLPTITCVNKAFFDAWPEKRRYKEPRLDEIKHKEKGGYYFNQKDGHYPIHLAAELQILDQALDRAATDLGMGRCKSFLIASDHGASRLAVIERSEHLRDTDTKGEHSGRCCKEYPDADLTNAVIENGFVVLTDYRRYKGSRAANVEVHGGASLEEVLVPIITLTMRKAYNLEIKLINPETIIADKTKGTTLKLYISDVEHPDNVSVVLNDSAYPAIRHDDSHYTVLLPDRKRASKKELQATVYDGDDLIGSVSFEIFGKLARKNDDFDSLFE